MFLFSHFLLWNFLFTRPEDMSDEWKVSFPFGFGVESFTSFWLLYTQRHTHTHVWNVKHLF